MQNYKIESKYLIRSVSNDNERAKQYFTIITNDGMKPALAIEKLVFTNRNFELYEKYGFQMLKQVKGYRLYRQVFSIKLETLNAFFINYHNLSR